MLTELKPAEAGHLSIPEYYRFCEWWEGSEYQEVSEETAREAALEAYKYALGNIDYSARH